MAQNSPSRILASPADTVLVSALAQTDLAGAVIVEDKFRELHTLLGDVEPINRVSLPADVASDLCSAAKKVETPRGAIETGLDLRLAQARLGLASSLLTALRCKNASTAAHSVRVALGCSAWSLALELPPAQRDALEIAALLHDIGKIGVPDAVLLKPGALTAHERAVMDGHRGLGLQILESCCASSEVLLIVRHSAAWFDGSRKRNDCQGADLPLGARILAIVNAFDSMTTPQVYRPAMSHDQALQELCDHAGTQFDPQLVFHFAELLSIDQQKLHGRVAQRWLQELDPDACLDWWQQSAPRISAGASGVESLHQQRLLENMYDGIIFLGPQLQVMHWNRGAERLTGINGSSMLERPFVPSLVNLRDEHGRRIADDQCPVAQAMHSGVQSLRRLLVRGRGSRDLPVDMHMIPIVGPDGATQGVTMLLHDASGEASLEDRCQHLYQQAIRDPLTQLANRAEFDRAHALFVEVHRQRQLPCSLIICDIDRFKQINDTFGHLAGDEIIKSFAQLLKNACHPGDLVARFGGEEFVMLCADCNNASAAARAEQVRRAFSELSHPAIGGKTCFASFGVTEIQAGDTVQTMLNRADRALLTAKEAGRNLVVQLGSGWSSEPAEMRRRWRFWRKNITRPLLEKCLVTNVPLDITVEKLRGFVSDQRGQITAIENERVELVLQSGMLASARRRSDRSVPLVVELKFAREARKSNSKTSGRVLDLPPQTNIEVIIRTWRGRDRRYVAALDQARRVLVSLRSYLMANDVGEQPKNAVSQSEDALSQYADLTPTQHEAVLSKDDEVATNHR